MDTPDPTGLGPLVAKKIKSFIEEVLQAHASNIHSIHITGSAVIPDYNEKLSDINSVVVLHNMDLRFITFLAPLGKKYGKKRIAAPLVMTPEYVRTSLDAFPIEFLDFKLIHKTVYGPDIFAALEIAKAPLRIQCEREVKVKLMGLRQGYLSSLGDKDRLAHLLIRSFTGSMALFRAIITLIGKEPPIMRADVMTMFGTAAGIGTDALETLLRLKAKAVRPSGRELHMLFERYYATLEAVEKTVDGLRV